MRKYSKIVFIKISEKKKTKKNDPSVLDSNVFFADVSSFKNYLDGNLEMSHSQNEEY